MQKGFGVGTEMTRLCFRLPAKPTFPLFVSREISRRTVAIAKYTLNPKPTIPNLGPCQEYGGTGRRLPAPTESRNVVDMAGAAKRVQSLGG